MISEILPDVHNALRNKYDVMFRNPRNFCEQPPSPLKKNRLSSRFFSKGYGSLRHAVSVKRNLYSGILA